jgi:hypothetical protein
MDRRGAGDGVQLAERRVARLLPVVRVERVSAQDAGLVGAERRPDQLERLVGGGGLREILAEREKSGAEEVNVCVVKDRDRDRPRRKLQGLSVAGAMLRRPSRARRGDETVDHVKPVERGRGR